MISDETVATAIRDHLQETVLDIRVEDEGADMKVFLNDDLIFRKAHEALQWCTQDRESRELALSRERFLRDQASNLIDSLEQGINTGREENKRENARTSQIRSTSSAQR
jgi:hypothetical protein